MVAARPGVGRVGVHRGANGQDTLSTRPLESHPTAHLRVGSLASTGLTSSISRSRQMRAEVIGIVLASVAFDAGIINAKFYTAGVLVAVITSRFAGAWLEYVLHRGRPLLSMDKMESQIAAQGDDTVAA